MQDHVNLHKEIDLIQTCITRMAQNSFMLKGWYLSLVAILITILFGQSFKLEIIALFILVISVAFWGLDAFFLKTETLYRWKYEWVIQDRIKGNSNNEFQYDLNPYNKKMWIAAADKNVCFMKFVLSKTLLPIYGVPTAIAFGMLIDCIIR